MATKGKSGKQGRDADQLPSVYEEPRELRKAVEAIHISSTKLSLLQKKVFNNLVYYALPELLNKEIHSVSLDKLAKEVGFDSKNVEFLKNSIRSLNKTQVEFNVLRHGSEVWNTSALLAEASIGNGQLSYSIPPTLRKMLHNPKMFALINLNIQRLFNSGHAYSLYENTFRFKDVGSTGFISIEDWKKLFGIEADSYPEFKYFNKEVLKPSIEEVNRVTDIFLDLELKKNGNRVVALKFLIRMKSDVNVDFVPDDQTKVLVLSRLLNLGITEKTARGYLEKYPLDYIEGNLNEVEDRIKSKKVTIKNLPAYFKKALDEDFRPVDPPIVSQARAEKAAEQSKQDREKERLEEIARQQKQRLADARQYFDAMDPTDKAAYEQEFSVYLENKNQFAFKTYKSSGLGSKVIRTLFDTWLADKLEGAF